MVGTIKRRTNNYNLGIASFDSPIWQLVYENAMDVIDAALFALSGIGNVVGVWDNATGYTLTQRVVDDTDNTMWECITAHTSEATGTFAADRAANTDRWQQVVSTFYNGGEWATGTDYNANTFVRSGNYLGIVVSSYTSGATYAADVSNGDIVTIVDFTSYISAAQDEVDNAAAQVVLAAAQVALAEEQVTLAEAQVSLAADEVTNAQAQVALAAAEVVNAADEVANAAEWADNDEDTPVSVGAGGDGSTTFSAKHWSKKAEATAGTVEPLPDDTGETDKFLQTDGAGTKSWTAIPTPSYEIADNVLKVLGSEDSTKKVRFEVDGLTTEIERTLTVPDASGTLALTSDISSPGLVLLSTQTVSSPVAAVEFTSLIDSTYDEYEIHLYNVIPVDDGGTLELRTSTNGGSSFDATGGNYNYIYKYITSAGTENRQNSASAAEIRLSQVIGSDTNESGVSGVIKIFTPSLSQYCRFNWHLSFINSIGDLSISYGSGQRLSSADVDAVQFLMSSNNVESGTFKLYGVRK
jgi:hypothetical protein